MLYQITAYKFGQGLITLHREGSDLDAIKARLADEGYRVIDVSSTRTTPFSTGRQTFSPTLFAQQLHDLLSVGLKVIEALEFLAGRERKLNRPGPAASLLRRLQEGVTFARALADEGGKFPALMIGLVQASEQTSNLEEALHRFLIYEERIQSIKGKIISASVYPALLAVVGTAVIGFLLGYVVPKFSRIYVDFADRLPWMSQFVLHWGELIESHGLLIGGLALAVVAVTLWMLLRPAGRRVVAGWVVGLPGIRERAREFELARLYRTTGMLLRGGIPLVTALQMIGPMLRPATRRALDQAIEQIRAGHPLSDAFEQVQLSTDVAVQVIMAGERGGNLGAVLEKLADYHDRELGRWIDWFTRLFSPVLILFVGAIVGLIVLMLYMPIFELADNIR